MATIHSIDKAMLLREIARLEAFTGEMLLQYERLRDLAGEDEEILSGMKSGLDDIKASIMEMRRLAKECK